MWGGKFAPISGLVTNAVGTGAGEIFFPTNAEAGFAAYVQPTTVRLYDDATRALSVNVDLPRKLAVNTSTLTNDLHIQNPIELNGVTSDWDVWVDAGHCYLDGAVNYTVDGTPSTANGSLAKKGENGVLHMPSTSTFRQFYSQGGLVEFPENSRFAVDTIVSTTPAASMRFHQGSKATVSSISGSYGGRIAFEEGSELAVQDGVSLAKGTELVVSNATFTMAGGDFKVSDGTAVVKGGTFTDSSSGWTCTHNTGHLTFDGGTATFNAAVVAGNDASGTNFCGKSLLKFAGGVQATVPNLYAMNGDLEIAGDGTRVVSTGGIYAGGGSVNVCTNAASSSRIFITGGSVESAKNFDVGLYSDNDLQ